MGGDASLALDVAAAEYFLQAIPLLENDVIRKRSTSLLQPHLERQHTGSSEGCAHAGGWGQTAVMHQSHSASADGSLRPLGLDVHRAEHFLLSLDVTENELHDEMGFVAPQTQPAVARPVRKGQSARPGARGAARSRGERGMKPGIIKKGLLGGQAIMARRRHQSNVISTLPYIDNVGVLQVQSRSEAAPVRSHGGSLFARCCSFFCSFFCPQRREEVEVIGTSYKQYLVPGESGSYDPNFLDDRSQHHTVVNVESHGVSVNPFSRKSRFKEDMNEQFRQLHPWLDRSLTLSKLRNLQKDLREMTLSIPELDISTVAIAWVYFEKLVLGNHVRKSNRKLLAGACLVLAFKFNQHGDRSSLQQLACCIRKLDRKDQLNLDDLQDAELKVFVWLKFSLLSRDADVMPHLLRMLSDLGRDIGEYYGAEALRGTYSSFNIYEDSVNEELEPPAQVCDEPLFEHEPASIPIMPIRVSRRICI